jgi:asparagine synthase (glutamine-hydrolysing)/amidotransferase
MITIAAPDWLHATIAPRSRPASRHEEQQQDDEDQQATCPQGRNGHAGYQSQGQYERTRQDRMPDRQLISDVPLGTLLSGGLDSSTITALAQRHGQVRSFAVDFAGYADNFEPDEMRVDADGPFIAEFVRQARPDHTAIMLDTGELTDPGLRSAVVRAWDLPQFFGDMNTSLYMLFRAIRSHTTVALSGESADEVFGGYAWFHAPQAVQADTFPWLAFLMRNQTPADLLDQDLLAKLDMTAFIADSYRSALAEVPYLPGQRGLERRMRQISYLHLTRFLPALLDRKDRTSMAVGLEVRVPFCDHRLVEYVFNTPWAMKSFDGREKSLLRAAAKDLLPASITERVKSPYPATQDPGYERTLRAGLAAVVADTDSPVLPLLDLERVRKLVDRPMGDVSQPYDRGSLEMALWLNAWLTEYQVTLDL